MEKKVRVYQAQSRLVGLHAACVLIMGRIAGSVSPAFKVTFPKGTVEALNVSFCEICHLREIPEHSFVALYNDMRVMLKRLMRAEDRVRLQAQFEVMQYVRTERVEARLAEGQRLNLPCVTHDGGGCGGTLETGHNRLCPHDPEIANLAPSLRKRATEIATAMRPTPPPIRPTPMKNVRSRRPVGPRSVPRGLVGPGGAINVEKRGPAPRGETVSPAQAVLRPGNNDPATLDAAFMFLEADAVARRKPFKFNVEGATGEGRSARLPDKSKPPTFPKSGHEDYLALANRIIGGRCDDPKCLKHGAKPAKGFRCVRDVRK